MFPRRVPQVPVIVLVCHSCWTWPPTPGSRARQLEGPNCIVSLTTQVGIRAGTASRIKNPLERNKPLGLTAWIQSLFRVGMGRVGVGSDRRSTQRQWFVSGGHTSAISTSTRPASEIAPAGRNSSTKGTRHGRNRESSNVDAARRLHRRWSPPRGRYHRDHGSVVDHHRRDRLESTGPAPSTAPCEERPRVARRRCSRPAWPRG
jgi:hypothetical protein